MKNRKKSSALALVLSVIMLLSCCVTASAAQTSGVAASVPDASICLKDNWHVMLDKGDLGETEEWYTGFPGSGSQVSLPYTAANDGNACAVWFYNEFTPDVEYGDGQRIITSFEGLQYSAKIWLNGNYVGEHEGSYGCFSFDISDFLRLGEENMLAIRLFSARGGATINELDYSTLPLWLDSAQFIQTPVYISVLPETAITDVYVAPSFESGVMQVQVTLDNAGESAAKVGITADVASQSAGVSVAGKTLSVTAQPGTSQHTFEIPVKDFHAWSPDDPYLYDVTVRTCADGAAYADSTVVSVGFKDLRVDDLGRFVLNGERFYVKCLHTSPWCSSGTNSVNVGADIERQLGQLDFFKASGFNMVRFIGGPALPEMLDYCDRIGLLVYEEHAMSWKSGSDQSETLLRREVSQLVERDRNHASFAIIGMLNETYNNEEDQSAKLYTAAVGALDVVRAYDSQVLVLLSSGRWDNDIATGSACNPGSDVWDGYMGDEGSTDKPTGNFSGMGDIHYYPHMPYSGAIRLIFSEINGLRATFISEAGAGSQANVVSGLRIAQQDTKGAYDVNNDPISWQVQTLYSLYSKYGMSSIFASPEALVKATQVTQSSQRALFFDFIRSNPAISGYSMTQGTDAGQRGEGILEKTNDYKSGMYDMLRDGWNDMRWCLNADRCNIYNDEGFGVDILFSSLRPLEKREYTATLTISGASGKVLERSLSFTPADDEKGEPLSAVSVLKDTLDVSACKTGEYTVTVTLDGTLISASKTFWITDREDVADISGTIYQDGLSEEGIEFLRAHGVTVEELDYENIVPGSAVLLARENVRNRELKALYESVSTDGTKILGLNPDSFGDWGYSNLPLGNQIANANCNNWLYHFDTVILKTDATKGLANNCLMDPVYYNDIFPTTYFTGLPAESEMHALAMFIGNDGGASGQPLRYGPQLATYNYGSGCIVLNTFRVIDNIGTPAADQLMLNLVDYTVSK